MAGEPHLNAWQLSHGHAAAIRDHLPANILGHHARHLQGCVHWRFTVAAGVASGLCQQAGCQGGAPAGAIEPLMPCLIMPTVGSSCASPGRRHGRRAALTQAAGRSSSRGGAAVQ